MSSIVLPIKLSADIQRRIEELAQRDEALASQFVESVLREAFGFDDEERAAIERGLADAAAGRTISTDELRARIDKKLG